MLLLDCVCIVCMCTTRYTRKMDDGANPKEWKSADLLVLGVSRCGKTPLSIFLGQRGYKVPAHLPGELHAL